MRQILVEQARRKASEKHGGDHRRTEADEADLAIEWKSVSGDPVAWDGRLEVFNGGLLSMQSLASGVEMVDSASWRSAVEGATTAGVRATIRYGYN